MIKVILTVTSLSETYKKKGIETVEANIDPNLLNFLSALRVETEKGTYKIGDKIEVTIKKVES